MRKQLLSILAISLFSACDIEEPGSFDAAELDASAEARAWDSSNNPSNFSSRFEYRLSSLPSSGRVRNEPWAASYWPTYKDSINYRWQGGGSMSPAEKYERAFNKPGFANRVSREYGANSRSGNIPTWFGLCHAWAPAAIMEPQPMYPVYRNGVKFEVNDIKALVTLAYDKGVQTDFLSQRCNTDGDYWSTECADTNPGTLHVTLANMIGIRGESFIEDRTIDTEVWNQPITGFRVLDMRQVSRSEASGLIPRGARFSSRASSFYRVQTKVYWVTESDAHEDGYLDTSNYTKRDVYDYILELDSSGRIIGGEWIGSSIQNHPDFLWRPTGKSATSVAGMSWYDVKDLVRASQTRAND